MCGGGKGCGLWGHKVIGRVIYKRVWIIGRLLMHIPCSVDISDAPTKRAGNVPLPLQNILLLLLCERWEEGRLEGGFVQAAVEWDCEGRKMGVSGRGMGL